MPESDDSPWRIEGQLDGATPLEAEEQRGLKPSWIATRADLNAAEFENIAKALASRRWRSRSTEQLLDDLAVRELHKAMFGDVWLWAGAYRLSEKNIGCDPADISVKVRDLCDDARFWLDGARPSYDEAACKVHRDLVAIHPFANGNGRHSRTFTDLLLESLGAPPFTWGRVSHVTPAETRRTYIAALRAADAGDYAELLAFARS
jgi:Fic-DOC domain mobile mystery protein B